MAFLEWKIGFEVEDAYLKEFSHMTSRLGML